LAFRQVVGEINEGKNCITITLVGHTDMTSKQGFQ